MGQLCEVAECFYKLTDLKVRVLESKNDNPGSTTGPVSLDAKTVFVKYRLDFDNREYVSRQYHLSVEIILTKIKVNRVEGKKTQPCLALNIDDLFNNEHNPRKCTLRFFETKKSSY